MRRNFTISLDNDVIEKARKIHRESKIPISRLFEEGFIEKYGGQK